MALDDDTPPLPPRPRRPQPRRRFWPALIPPLAGLTMLGALVGYLRFGDAVAGLPGRLPASVRSLLGKAPLPPVVPPAPTAPATPASAAAPVDSPPGAGAPPLANVPPNVLPPNVSAAELAAAANAAANAARAAGMTVPAGAPLNTMPPGNLPPGAVPGELPSQDVSIRDVHTIPGSPGDGPTRRVETNGTLPDLGPGTGQSASAGAAPTPAPAPAVSAGNFLIGPAKAMDGRTLDVDGRLVRLVGVDVPAADARCRKANNTPWPCGEMIRTFLATRLSPGSAVTCLPTGKSVGNVALATCRDGSGIDLGSWLIMQGNAQAGRDSPEHAALETYARNQKLGLWADGSLPFRR